MYFEIKKESQEEIKKESPKRSSSKFQTMTLRTQNLPRKLFLVENTLQKKHLTFSHDVKNSTYLECM